MANREGTRRSLLCGQAVTDREAAWALDEVRKAARFVAHIGVTQN
jgi:hypothetical protein